MGCFGLVFIGMFFPVVCLGSLCPAGTYSASGKPVNMEDVVGVTGSQSDYYNPFPWTHAIDNDLSTSIQTQNTDPSWWNIDLQGVYYVANVSIWSAGSNWGRDSYTQIYVGNNSVSAVLNTLCGDTGDFTEGGQKKTVVCNVYGRYVWAYKASTEYMNWGEIEIKGCPSCSGDLISSVGSTSCSCIPGYYIFETDKCCSSDILECCPMNQYWEGVCRECPAHMTSYPGSRSILHCVCDAGYYRTGLKTCTACPVGYECPGSCP